MRTTFSDLVDLATDCLSQDLPRHVAVMRRQASGLTPTEQHELAEAHADLTDALHQLGSYLLNPSGSISIRARSGDDLKILAALGRRARRRDWTALKPTKASPAWPLMRAAQLTRAATDLWNTHRTAAGAPRTAEGSLMRHPSTLGAAIREWRRLVCAAAVAADMIHDGWTRGSTVKGRSFVRFPRPRIQTISSMGRVSLGVAIAPDMKTNGPLARVDERVDHIRRLTWAMRARGQSSVPIILNLAAIGIILSDSHAQALSRAQAPSRQSDHELPCASSCDCSDSAIEIMVIGAKWQAVLTLTKDLTSAHPQTTALQVERQEISRLCELLFTSHDQDWDSTTSALAGIVSTYSEIGEDLAMALGKVNPRYDFFIRGKTLKHDFLTRRPDLIAAKFANHAVPATQETISSLQDALSAISRRGTILDSRAHPPAIKAHEGTAA